MDEIINQQEATRNSLRKQFDNLVEYGEINGGWGSLLSLKNLEEDVFLVDSLWQEVKVKGADDSVHNFNKAEEAVEAINAKVIELNELAEDIQGRFALMHKIGLSKKKDAGVVMGTLRDNNFSKLDEKEIEVLGGLLAKMGKFKESYENWVKWRKGNFNELNKFLKAVVSSKTMYKKSLIHGRPAIGAADYNK